MTNHEIKISTSTDTRNRALLRRELTVITIADLAALAQHREEYKESPSITKFSRYGDIVCCLCILDSVSWYVQIMCIRG